MLQFIYLVSVQLLPDITLCYNINTFILNDICSDNNDVMMFLFTPCLCVPIKTSRFHMPPGTCIGYEGI